jgi:RimJ/RimL family protein N-acetyltransferase
MKIAHPASALGPGNVLTTPRLELRVHTLDDFEACVLLWSDPDVVRHIGGKPFTREEVWQRLLRYAGHWSLSNFGFWTIRDSATDEFLGEIGLADFKREMTPSFGTAPECGWALLPSAQGKGLAAEALGAALGWADANLAAPRIVCMIDLANTRSTRLARRFGFIEYGVADYRGAQSAVFERATMMNEDSDGRG